MLELWIWTVHPSLYFRRNEIKVSKILVDIPKGKACVWKMDLEVEISVFASLSAQI